MRKVKEFIKNSIIKYGAVIATCAFAFVTISANTSCGLPYYEPEEPEGLDRFKKFSK